MTQSRRALRRLGFRREYNYGIMISCNWNFIQWPRTIVVKIRRLTSSQHEIRRLGSHRKNDPTAQSRRALRRLSFRRESNYGMGYHLRPSCACANGETSRGRASVINSSAQSRAGSCTGAGELACVRRGQSAGLPGSGYQRFVLIRVAFLCLTCTPPQC